MPKRKADSDAEEDEYPSFPASSKQPSMQGSPNFNLPSTQLQRTTIPSTKPPSFSGFDGPKNTLMGCQTDGQLNKPGYFGLAKPHQVGQQGHQQTSTTSVTSSSASGAKTLDFSRSVRDLNMAFNSSVRNAVSKNPSHSLLPLVKDYLYHSRVLLEQSKRGNSPPELLNGNNSPPKNFKSLGEFFDDFEKRYIEQGGDCNKVNEVSEGTSSAFNNSIHSSATETKSKPNFNNSTFKLIPPKPVVDNTKVTTMPPPPPPPEIKMGSTNSFPTSALFGSKTTDKIASPSFGGSSVTTSSPSQSSSLPSSSSFGNPLKSLSDPAPFAPKPVAPFSGFSFFKSPSTSASASFGSNTPAPAATSEGKGEDEEGEDDEPPKVEITPVAEDDAVYSIRCKVFGVVDGKLKDKGIGMLYVKKLEDLRHQVVVRADNNLGTVILNILLQKSLPLQMNGKNAISTVDLQANNQKGMPIIIRVKTEDDAKELLGKLKELQQSS